MEWSVGKKSGAPAWEREPRKARFDASVVFTPARGVIHPSFPLRGRWERFAKSDERAPSPSLASLRISSIETRPRQLPMHEARHHLGGLASAQSYILQLLILFGVRAGCPKSSLQFQFGTVSNLNRELRHL
jgi:hypothetical protein